MMNSNRIEPLVAIALVALLAIGTFYILSPFLPALLYAVILTVSTWPAFMVLEKRLGGRTTLAAAIMTLFFTALLLGPLIVLSLELADQVPRIVNGLKNVVEEGLPSAPAWLEKIPYIGDSVAQRWQEFSQDTRKLGPALRPYLSKGAELTLGLGANIGQTIVQLLISLIVAFFAYRDGRPIVRHLTALIQRVSGEQGKRLLNVAGATMRAVVYGILGAAVVQGVLATLGLWTAGIPGWLFLGVACGVLALIPIGLIMLVMFGSVAWLFYQGSTGWGIALLLWSLLVVGQVDNFIRPIIISRGANLPIIVVLLGVLGGLAVAGILGLFVGATVVGVFYTMLLDWGVEPPPVPESELPAERTAASTGTGP